MKKISIVIFILFSYALKAQTALQNSGNIRIHEDGKIGFHTNLINEAPFDTNLGLVGFYGLQNLTVSGTVTPQFYDSEILLNNNLILDIGVDITNNFNFISGNVTSSLDQSNTHLNFTSTGFYTGETNLSKIIGYSAITNKQNFIFPVGDEDFFRPLVINSEDTNFLAKCAYFFENPNNPIHLSKNYNTLEINLNIESVSDLEFWNLEGSVPSKIKLSWNERSDMSKFTDDYTKIITVGWSKLSQRWISLSGDTPIGDLSQGFVTSTSFVPDDYEIITLGVSKIPNEPLFKEVLNLENYFLSANGDGINDSFYIPELEDFNHNLVQIYDRYGSTVFKMANYTNEFIGFSNQNNVPFNKESGLPTGVYFYTVYIADEDLNYQGFLYLTR